MSPAFCGVLKKFNGCNRPPYRAPNTGPFLAKKMDRIGNAVKEDICMQTEVKIGQSWVAWVPSRRQWLLTTVIRQQSGQATLKYDARYGINLGDDEYEVDEATLLTTPNLFRFVEPAN
jgi:hypothetical protein